MFFFNLFCVSIALISAVRGSPGGRLWSALLYVHPYLRFFSGYPSAIDNLCCLLYVLKKRYARTL